MCISEQGPYTGLPSPAPLRTLFIARKFSSKACLYCVSLTSVQPTINNWYMTYWFMRKSSCIHICILWRTSLQFLSWEQISIDYFDELTNSSVMANSWQLVLNIGVRASSATPPIGPQDSFSAGTQKTFCAGLGRNWRRQTQAEPGALGCAWGAVEYDFGERHIRHNSPSLSPSLTTVATRPPLPQKLYM